ncbi:hypothetical protein, partial [Helicobacter sp.]|uniref:hypothetical protein n=1 Tax=Helicobacter sp. TaxID=218 RepID=UPI002A75288C
SIGSFTISDKGGFVSDKGDASGALVITNSGTITNFTNNGTLKFEKKSGSITIENKGSIEKFENNGIIGDDGSSGAKLVAGENASIKDFKKHN